MPLLQEVDDLDGGAAVPDPHRRLHLRRPLGASSDRAGHLDRQADAVFTKLDPSVVDEELARLVAE
jgi:hypothetical protein